MQFKSLIQLLEYFKDEKIAIEYYENRRWGGNPVCPHCGSEKPYKTTRGYKCSNKVCHLKFTVRIGTIFENSKVPLRKWFAALYLVANHKKGISSVQLALDIGVTQKTAWFMLHRLREMLRDKAPEMLDKDGIIEGDECFIGGKEKNKHWKKKRSEDKVTKNDGTPYKPKKVVMGVIQRGGKVVLKHVPSRQKEDILPFIKEYVPKDAEIHTDEYRSYGELGKWYTHETINHSLKVYVDGNVHTNTIENFWSVLKRGINGIYHQVSEKHVKRYLDEFSARFNTRKMGLNERFDNFLNQGESVLSYKVLIEKE